MKRYLLMFFLLAIMMMGVVGCSSHSSTSNNKIETISAEKAKEMMDHNKDIILLDVRTQEEYNEGHIKNSILIPDYEVKAKAGELLTDKNATILVYCRSGRRSALASQALSELGYTSIYDFGGIIDWPYDTVQ